MAKQVQMTFWNYNSFKDYKPQMLRDWIELGITLPLLPMFNMNRDSKEVNMGRRVFQKAGTVGAKALR